jgi:hypothetical protein
MSPRAAGGPLPAARAARPRPFPGCAAVRHAQQRPPPAGRGCGRASRGLASLRLAWRRTRSPPPHGRRGRRAAGALRGAGLRVGAAGGLRPQPPRGAGGAAKARREVQRPLLHGGAPPAAPSPTARTAGQAQRAAGAAGRAGAAAAAAISAPIASCGAFLHTPTGMWRPEASWGEAIAGVRKASGAGRGRARARAVAMGRGCQWQRFTPPFPLWGAATDDLERAMRTFIAGAGRGRPRRCGSRPAAHRGRPGGGPARGGARA